MTTPTSPANEPEPMTFAEMRALLSETVRGLSETRKIVDENTRAIAEMRAANAERDTRHDKEMAEIRDAIARLTAVQNRTNQDVSTLKGWGLELYCERHPEAFLDAFGMNQIELIPKRDIMSVSYEACRAGFITFDQQLNLNRTDLFFFGRRAEDRRPFCLVVKASFVVGDEDVERAAGRAGILNTIIKKYQPRNIIGEAIPVVAGTKIESAPAFKAENYGVRYVQVQNGNQLTNPPE